jgi:hypothetical protein
MNFKRIKKAPHVYKRVGPFKTSYRVKFRQNGIYLNAPLIGAKNDLDAISKARIQITDAEDLAARKQFKDKPSPDKLALVRFDALIDEVIDSKPNPRTRKQVEYFLKRVVLPILNKYCPFVQSFGPTGPEDFVTWFQKERPGQRLFNPRKYFLQVLKRAKKKGILESHFEISIPNPDSKRDAGKVYSDHEIARLLENAKGDIVLQILMAYTMGMRRSEILKLRWDRINWTRQTIALKAEDTKIKRGREFKVNQLVWDLLLERRRAIKEEFVFPSPKCPERPISDNKSAWQALKLKVKVKGRFHDLRHTFLTNEISRKKHQAMDVCTYAGLSIEELKETYLHPDYVDTAYIADNQNDKIISTISTDKILDKILDKKIENV